MAQPLWPSAGARRCAGTLVRRSSAIGIEGPVIRRNPSRARVRRPVLRVGRRTDAGACCCGGQPRGRACRGDTSRQIAVRTAHGPPGQETLLTPGGPIPRREARRTAGVTPVCAFQIPTRGGLTIAPHVPAGSCDEWRTAERQWSSSSPLPRESRACAPVAGDRAPRRRAGPAVLGEIHQLRQPPTADLRLLSLRPTGSRCSLLRLAPAVTHAMILMHRT
jgi:hypothetical protein